MERPNCLKCKHYHSTYDAKSPRGCRIYGFKSMSMPSIMVKNETGKDCQAYDMRKHFDKNAGKLDLNRDDLW